jgi:hypothetical protein
MKFATVLTIVMLAALSVCFARGRSGGTNCVGGKVGLNISSVWGDDVGDYVYPIIGFNAGGFATFYVNRNFAFQPEFVFSMKGANYDDDIYKSTMTLSYLEIPLLAKFMLPTRSNAKPSFFIGPAVSILASDNFSDGYFWIGAFNVRPVDFGIVFGTDLVYDMRQYQFLLDVRCNLGILLIDNDEYINAYNDVISISAGVGFPIK